MFKINNSYSLEPCHHQNASYLYLAQQGTTPGQTFIIQEESISSLLGVVSVFVSSFLLSCGAFAAVMFSGFRRSNCTKVDCLCWNCTRKNLEVEGD